MNLLVFAIMCCCVVLLKFEIKVAALSNASEKQQYNNRADIGQIAPYSDQTASVRAV